jgi:hypothetical protein
MSSDGEFPSLIERSTRDPRPTSHVGGSLLQSSPASIGDFPLPKPSTVRGRGVVNNWKDFNAHQRQEDLLAPRTRGVYEIPRFR